MHPKGTLKFMKQKRKIERLTIKVEYFNISFGNLWNE